MADYEYSERRPYDGKPLREVLKAVDMKEYRKAMKKAYRAEGRKARKIVERYAAASGLANGGKVARSIRVRAYPKPYGFMLTVKPHGKQGYYTRRQDGKQKPVAMWAEGGTKERYTRKGWHTKFRGRMRAYQFMGKAAPEALKTVEADMLGVLEQTAKERLSKLE